MSWLKPTLLTLAVLAVALPALSEQMTFVLDSERSEVRILLGATLHTVPGSAPIGPATLTWDTESGEASGQVVIQSAELDTRIDARNAKMHEIVLKTLEHPEIIFEATGFELRQPGDDEMRFVLPPSAPSRWPWARLSPLPARVSTSSTPDSPTRTPRSSKTRACPSSAWTSTSP
jgi:hypothetical protein